MNLTAVSGVYGREARPELWGPVRRLWQQCHLETFPGGWRELKEGPVARKRHRGAEISSSQQLSTPRHEEEALLSDHLGDLKTHQVLVAYARGETAVIPARE